MKITGNEIRPGMIIVYKDKLWRAIKTEHTKPGKGGAYLQAELKSIPEGIKLHERFRSSEAVERASIEERKFQYLYQENDSYVFMDNENFEQVYLNNNQISEEEIKLLSENLEVTISFYDNNPIFVILPKTITVEVLDTEVAIKGQTVTSSFKPATVKNNLRVMVPTHIDIGAKIIISTEDLSYSGKAK